MKKLKIENFIGVGSKILLNKFLEFKQPVVTFFSITDRCNLRCKYCEIWKRNEKELTTSQVFKIIDDISNLGVYRISFCGGEPLMRKDIGKIIKYAKEKGLHVGMGSNGWYVPKRINEIKNLDTIQFGFDGPKEVHDLQRGKGSYDKLMKAIRTCISHNIKTFTTMVITKENVNYVDYMLELAEKMEFFIFFQPVMCRPLTGKYTSTLLPSPQKYKKAVKKLIERKKSCKFLGNSLSILKYYYQWPKLPKIRCWAGFTHFAIDTNGNVFSCLDMRGKETPLNCIKVGAKVAFDGIKKYECEGCWTYGHLELNLLSSFNLEVIFNSFKLIR